MDIINYFFFFTVKAISSLCLTFSTPIDAARTLLTSASGTKQMLPELKGRYERQADVRI